MNRLTILLLTLMAFSFSSLAQTKQAVSLQWKITGELPATSGQEKALGFAGPVAGENNGVLMVGGGSNFPGAAPWLGGRKTYYNDGYVFKKNSNDSFVLHKAFKLPFNLAYSACVSTSQGIVCAGGESENGPTDKVLLIQWNNEINDAVFKNLPALPLALTNASATFLNGCIYIAGGETASGVSDGFFYLDLKKLNEGWKALPSLPKAISHAVMVVQWNGQRNCIYLLGGRKKNTNAPSDLYASVFQFDFVANKWSEKHSLPYAMSAGTGVATGKNFILLFGGDKGETFHKTEVLIAAIAAEKDSAKKEQLNQQKAALQATHPGFSKDILVYDAKKDQWAKDGCIPFPVPVTTTAIKWGNEVLIPGGEIKAGVRTPQILSAKINQ
ncbi:hypothetical protein [Flavisolibacter ginsenosidimutans]|uniref:Galactose oxidase n=1 Tax=Flavisolibacter ginsenosidimutans TaxID=661481 RepID=A0A5B8UEF8_9BACT|nr:hypothetical protein [Flavisolibacter ginsenosidimutans]QEC54480.1 hypothetical protein FSB75_00725 [Flavisolibacter ginsenosidimutans]